MASPANETVFQGCHKAWFPYVAHLGMVRNANDAAALRNRERGTVGLEPPAWQAPQVTPVQQTLDTTVWTGVAVTHAAAFKRARASSQPHRPTQCPGARLCPSLLAGRMFSMCVQAHTLTHVPRVCLKAGHRLDTGWS